MKRVKCVGLSLLLVLLVLALGGCKKEESVTAEGLLEEAGAKMSNAKSMSGNMKMDVSVSYKESGLSGSIGMTADLDIESTVEPQASHIKGSVGLLGMTIEMESYGVVENGRVVTYTNAMDEWSKTESGEMPSAGEVQNILKNFKAEDLGLALAEETEKLDDREVYALTGTLQGDVLAKLLESSGNALGDAMGDLGEGLDYSSMSADMKILIDKEGHDLAQIKIDVNGLNEMADLGEEVSIDTCSVTISYYSIDDVEEIVVPEEAKSASSSGGAGGLDLFGDLEEPSASDGPAKPETTGSLNNGELVQDDQGNYLLEGHYDDITAAVAVPEGFAIDSENSDPDCLFFDLVQDDEDKQMYVMCTAYLLEPTFGEDVFSEDHKQDVEAMADDSSYTDVQLSEVQTIMVGDLEVKYTKLSYSYAGMIQTVEYNTWAIQDGEKVISCDFTEQSYDGECDLVPDMEAVISSLYAGIKIN